MRGSEVQELIIIIENATNRIRQLLLEEEENLDQVVHWMTHGKRTSDTGI
jgi:hypothetical protein